MPLPTPGDLPDPGIETVSLASPALTGRFFTTHATWEAPRVCVCVCVYTRLLHSPSGCPVQVVGKGTPPLQDQLMVVAEQARKSDRPSGALSMAGL